MNYKLEDRIPWQFTDFDNIKDFPRLLKNLIPWLFPDLEKFSFFPRFSLTVATLELISNHATQFVVLCWSLCSETTRFHLSFEHFHTVPL